MLWQTHIFLQMLKAEWCLKSFWITDMEKKIEQHWISCSLLETIIILWNISSTCFNIPTDHEGEDHLFILSFTDVFRNHLKPCFASPQRTQPWLTVNRTVIIMTSTQPTEPFKWVWVLTSLSSLINSDKSCTAEVVHIVTCYNWSWMKAITFK